MKKGLLLLLVFMLGIGIYGCQSNDTTNNNTTTTTTAGVDFLETNSIMSYTRDTTSGTREAFFKGIGFDEAISDNTVLVSTYIEVDGNGSMITSLTNDLYGIGYISLASLDDTSLIGLEFEGVEATKENVVNGTYGLQRPFNYIVRSDWTGQDTERQIIEALIAYMSTIDGKATITNKHGIVDISSTDVLWDSIKDDYQVCSNDNSNITIQFGGSTSVESVARALSQEFSTKCGGFVAEHNHTGSGDGYLRTQGSEKDSANKIHMGFASRDFKTSEAYESGTTGLICLDAVVIVVNKDNPVLTNITMEDIKKIYAGEISTWSQLNN